MKFFALRQAFRDQLVDGLPDDGARQRQCISCIRGKQHSEAFPKASRRHASELLELVHTDVSGPMQTQLFGGALYFMLSIDDCSRCLRVSLQHEAFECFKGWKMYAEKVSEGVLDKQVASEGDSGSLPLAFTQVLLLGDRSELCSDLPPGVVAVPVIVAQPVVADLPYSVDETVFPMVCVPSSLELLQVNHTLLSSVLSHPQWKEAMYVDQYLGFQIPGSEDMVYRLQSALLGLMLTPRAWNKQIDLLLISQLCCRSHTVDLGLLHFFFRLEVSQTQRGMFSQQHFVCGLLEVNGMENARSISTLFLTDDRGVWLRWLLAELRSLQLLKMVFQSEYPRCIVIMENPVLRGRTKWIGMQYHFVRADGTISLEYCSPVDSVVDIFMKPLPQQLLLYCRCFSSSLGLLLDPGGKRGC